jgi:hypothetical protein
MSPSHTSGGEFNSGEIRRAEVKQHCEQQQYCRERPVGRQYGSENAALIAAVQQHSGEELRQAAKDRISAVPLVEITAGAVSQPSQRHQQQAAEPGLGGGAGAPQHRKRQREQEISQEFQTDRPRRIVPAELARPQALEHHDIGKEPADRTLTKQRYRLERASERIARGAFHGRGGDEQE